MIFFPGDLISWGANVLVGANVLGGTNVLVRANVLAGISNFQHSVDTIVQGLRQHEDSACRVPGSHLRGNPTGLSNLVAPAVTIEPSLVKSRTETCLNL